MKKNNNGARLRQAIARLHLTEAEAAVLARVSLFTLRCVLREGYEPRHSRTRDALTRFLARADSAETREDLYRTWAS